MSLFPKVLLTLGVGGIFGIILTLLKFPNGLRLGAIIGCALLGIFFKAAWMPSQTRFAVQVIAGGMIACTIERSDLRHLHKTIKPAVIALASFLILNAAGGILIHVCTALDWATSLMCVIPGGASEMPIIAADMGADVPIVALVQLTRNIMGVGLFPGMILAYDGFLQKADARKAAGNGLAGVPETDGGSSTLTREKSTVHSVQAIICTLAVSLAGGFFGKLTRLPAGTLLFSISAVLVLKLKFDFAFIPSWLRRIARWLSGCYIGSVITMDDVQRIKVLLIPLSITLGGYILNCLITGKILSKTCGFTRKEGLLTLSPAGASDMALNSAELGVKNPDVIIVQIFRAIVAATIFPQIINLLLFILR